jgi:hypothetical protein
MILYALLFGGLALAAVGGGAYFTGKKDGVEAQKMLDEPVIATARADRQTAIAANEGLQRDLVTIRDNVATCNLRVAAVKADSDIAVATMEKILGESEQRKRDYERIVNAFRAGARPTQAVAPDLQCAAAKATLVNYADTVSALEALGLPKQPGTLTIQPTSPATRPLPKSAIKTLPGAK